MLGTRGGNHAKRDSQGAEAASGKVVVTASLPLLLLLLLERGRGGPPPAVRFAPPGASNNNLTTQAAASRTLATPPPPGDSVSTQSRPPAAPPWSAGGEVVGKINFPPPQLRHTPPPPARARPVLQSPCSWRRLPRSPSVVEAHDVVVRRLRLLRRGAVAPSARSLPLPLALAALRRLLRQRSGLVRLRGANRADRNTPWSVVVCGAQRAGNE